MSVHVRYETPEDVSNKIYELVQACNGGRIKRGSNEVTKVALRKTAAFVVLAEDVNPPSSSTTSRSSVTTTAFPSATCPPRNSWPKKPAWKPV